MTSNPKMRNCWQNFKLVSWRRKVVAAEEKHKGIKHFKRVIGHFQSKSSAPLMVVAL
jgi:hypothetical protein